MKNAILIIFFFGYTLLTSAQVRNSSDFQIKNTIKFQPLTLPFNTVSFEYGRMISGKNSVSLQVGIPNQQSIIGKYGTSTNSDL